MKLTLATLMLAVCLNACNNAEPRKQFSTISAETALNDGRDALNIYGENDIVSACINHGYSHDVRDTLSGGIANKKTVTWNVKCFTPRTSDDAGVLQQWKLTSDNPYRNLTCKNPGESIKNLDSAGLRRCYTAFIGTVPTDAKMPDAFGIGANIDDAFHDAALHLGQQARADYARSCVASNHALPAPSACCYLLRNPYNQPQNPDQTENPDCPSDSTFVAALHALRKKYDASADAVGNYGDGNYPDLGQSDPFDWIQ